MSTRASSSTAPCSRKEALLETAVYHGWLYKRGPNQRFGWRKVWCVLQKEELTYYADEKMWEKKGDVPIRPTMVAVRFGKAGAIGEASLYMKEKPYGFVVDPGPPGKQRHLYYFDATSEELCNLWAGHLVAAAAESRIHLNAYLLRLYAKTGDTAAQTQTGHQPASEEEAQTKAALSIQRRARGMQARAQIGKMRKEQSNDRSMMEADEDAFCKIGGFLFKCSAGNVIKFCVLKPASGSGAQSLCGGWLPYDGEVKNWFCVTSEPLLRVGLERFAWTPPEKEKLPHGGFVYCLASGKTIVFPIGTTTGCDEGGLSGPDSEQAAAAKHFLSSVTLCGAKFDQEAMLEGAEMTAWANVAFTVHERRAAAVPLKAKSFTWVYPHNLAIENDTAFGKIGGLVCKDEKDSIIALRLVKPAFVEHRLGFGGFVELTGDVPRWFPTTAPLLREIGLTKFAWVAPGISGLCHGGFAFLLDSGKIAAFPVKSAVAAPPNTLVASCRDNEQISAIVEFLKPLGFSVTANHEEMLAGSQTGEWIDVASVRDAATWFNLPSGAKQFAWAYPQRLRGKEHAWDFETNRALVFIKPHAQTKAVRDLVSKTLARNKIQVLREGAITALSIDAKKLIDNHYYAIASKATLLTPDRLPVPADKFKEKFGEEWKDVLAAGKAKNAMQAAEAFGVDAAGLEAKWRNCEAAGLSIKFGGGFYCGKLTIGEQSFYVFNAFFMSMRSKFTMPGKSIYYYSVAWQAGDCTWAKFRNEIVGPTDPATAPTSAIRRTIHDQWQGLGLAATPDKSDNGVHASASPFEGMAERVNWLEIPVREDPFAAALLKRGMWESRIVEWAHDARVRLDSSGREGSVFDALEDMDAEDCLEKLVALHVLNQDTAAQEQLKLMTELAGEDTAVMGLQICQDKAIEEEELARANAAAKIQSMHRGRQARMRCQKLRTEQESQAKSVGASYEDDFPDADMNRAFIFVKPHAQNAKVRKLVQDVLKTNKMTILKEGEIEAKAIDSKQLIDRHYYAIASKATLLQPDQLPVPATVFKDRFGVEWEDVLKEGKAKNAVDAAKEFGLDAEGLAAEWNKCVAAKLGGGFYCAQMSIGGKELYVFNGFFMAMRGKFTDEGKSVYYFSVKWNPADCSWSKFRREVLGPTDPAAAPEGSKSIRRVILDQWQDLGLASAPDRSDNGVHGSASPFEAMAERICWLEGSIQKDPFGQVLLTSMEEDQIAAWCRDPVLHRQDGDVTVFDQLEDLDVDVCVNQIFTLDEQCFALGDEVSVKGIDTNGTIRFIGTGHFAPGVWAGVELREPVGKNDGSVKDVRYFTCEPKYGIFVRPTVCSKLPRAAKPKGPTQAEREAREAAARKIQTIGRGRQARKTAIAMKEQARMGQPRCSKA